MAALFTIVRPRILVAYVQLLDRMPSMAIDQRDRQDVVLNLLKHRHDANAAVVCPNNQRW